MYGIPYAYREREYKNTYVSKVYMDTYTNSTSNIHAFIMTRIDSVLSDIFFQITYDKVSYNGKEYYLARINMLTPIITITPDYRFMKINKSIDPEDTLAKAYKQYVFTYGDPNISSISLPLSNSFNYHTYGWEPLTIVSFAEEEAIEQILLAGLLFNEELLELCPRADLLVSPIIDLILAGFSTYHEMNSTTTIVFDINLGNDPSDYSSSDRLFIALYEDKMPIYGTNNNYIKAPVPIIYIKVYEEQSSPSPPPPPPIPNPSIPTQPSH